MDGQALHAKREGEEMKTIRETNETTITDDTGKVIRIEYTSGEDKRLDWSREFKYYDDGSIETESVIRADGLHITDYHYKYGEHKAVKHGK